MSFCVGFQVWLFVCTGSRCKYIFQLQIVIKSLKTSIQGLTLNTYELEVHSQEKTRRMVRSLKELTSDGGGLHLGPVWVGERRKDILNLQKIWQRVIKQSFIIPNFYFFRQHKSVTTINCFGKKQTSLKLSFLCL